MALVAAGDLAGAERATADVEVIAPGHRYETRLARVAALAALGRVDEAVAGVAEVARPIDIQDGTYVGFLQELRWVGLDRGDLIARLNAAHNEPR